MCYNSASTVESVRGIYLPLEVNQFAKLYTPIKTSLRIKYSCFAVSNHLIVIGANTGAVYVFVKQPLNYINFISNKERDVQIIRFSPDGKCIAIGTGSGAVIVWELNISHLQSSKKVLEVSEHRGSCISDMVWDNKGQQLFIGDSNGKISTAHMPGVIPRTVLSAAGGIRLRKPGIILVCETPVVQLDYDNDHLLVSCKHKSAIMNLKREEVTYVGSQERDGLFGACFYRDTQSVPNHTLVLSARPKGRIWKASLDGKVELTYKLKDLLHGIHITPIFGVSLKPKSERPEDTPGDQNIPNILKRIRVINDNLISWNAHTIYILNLLSNKITQHSLVKEIQELQVVENDLWISQGDPIQIRCLSLLHYSQLFKSLSQLQLHSQVTEILLEFGESLQGGVTDDNLDSKQGTPHCQDTTISPVFGRRTDNVVTTQQDLSVYSEVDNEHITESADLEEKQGHVSPCLDGNEQLEPELNSVNEFNTISSEQDHNHTFDTDTQSLPGELYSKPSVPCEEVASVLQQSSEQEAMYSVGVVGNSLIELSLPFPKISRIRKTQSLKEGDVTSNWSPKLVRKRSKKAPSSTSTSEDSVSLSRSGSESELVSKPTRALDLFATDIFKDTVTLPDRRRSTQLDDCPISEHISRSERKKKQKKRDSKSQIPPETSPQPFDQTNSIILQETVSTALEHSPDNTLKVEDSIEHSIEHSRNDKMIEDFSLNSIKILGEIESTDDDPSSTSPFVSSWLSSFLSLISSVPSSSLPGSHTIATLSLLSTSSTFHVLQQLATYAMLSGCWQSISFPNPLSATLAQHAPCNFFYLHAPFLQISEVRAYLTTRLHLLDRSSVYSLYIKGLQDFQENANDHNLDINSPSFPSQIRRDLQNGTEFCVDNFPCILPWEIFTIIFGSNNSPQKVQSHPHSQQFLDYMEKLFLSVDCIKANSKLLTTTFSTDHDSFMTWCYLSLQLLPTPAFLSVKDQLDKPKPDSHLLGWKYKQVWEQILTSNIIPIELVVKCLPYFKQHCFWIGVLYCYFVLDQREEATVLLLQLRDNSLIGQQDQAWGKYPNSIPDWRLTIEKFLTVFDREFTATSKEETRDRISHILRLAVRDIGCLSVVGLLKDIFPSLENTTNIKTWFPYDLFLKLIQIVNRDRERSKIAFHLLERLDEELWKRKPNAISPQFLLQDDNSSKENNNASTLETSGFQWGIRAKQNEFRCQSCYTKFLLPQPVLPSDIQVFACGHSYHKACLLEGACTLCYSEHLT